MNNSKVMVAVSRIVSIVQRALGLVIAIIFGVAFLALVFDSTVDVDNVSLTIIFIFTIIGIIIFLFGLKRSKSVKLFKLYVSYLSADSTCSIDNLAMLTGTSNDVVTKNLEYMISKKYFANAHINKETNCIIIGAHDNKVKDVVTVNVSLSNEPVQQQVEYYSVKCKNCGGVNKISKGNVAECDFCGSSIKGE